MWKAQGLALILLLNTGGTGVAAVAGLPISMERAGTNVLIRFSGSLQNAVRAEGPYQQVIGATSPYLGPTSNSQQFWRALLPGVRTLAAGGYHAVALRADGTLWTWGYNRYGQLGNGTFTTSFPYGADTPQPIQTNVIWRAVAGGEAHTVALRADGTLWTWGENDDGALGNGTFDQYANTPQPVQTNVMWQAVAAGGGYTVALRTDGTLWAWGYNGRGQLGNGALLPANTPQPVATNMTWLSVAAGIAHTAALRSDGTLWSWGANDSGQLGNGTFDSTNTPQPVATNMTWVGVAAGWAHTVALRVDGTLWLWGANGSGQLGIGMYGGAPNTPQPIQTNVTWRAVAAGARHTVALRADGTLWTWGANDNGKLGIGTFGGAANTPQRIQTNVTWQAVAAGYEHTVALRTDGTLWAWGGNDYSQLGNGSVGSANSANSPQLVAGGAVWGLGP